MSESSLIQNYFILYSNSRHRPRLIWTWSFKRHRLPFLSSNFFQRIHAEESNLLKWGPGWVQVVWTNTGREPDMSVRIQGTLKTRSQVEREVQSFWKNKPSQEEEVKREKSVVHKIEMMEQNDSRTIIIIWKSPTVVVKQQQHQITD